MQIIVESAKLGLSWLVQDHAWLAPINFCYIYLLK